MRDFKIIYTTINQCNPRSNSTRLNFISTIRNRPNRKIKNLIQTVRCIGLVLNRKIILKIYIKGVKQNLSHIRIKYSTTALSDWVCGICSQIDWKESKKLTAKIYMQKISQFNRKPIKYHQITSQVCRLRKSYKKIITCINTDPKISIKFKSTKYSQKFLRQINKISK